MEDTEAYAGGWVWTCSDCLTIHAIRLDVAYPRNITCNNCLEEKRVHLPAIFGGGSDA